MCDNKNKNSYDVDKDCSDKVNDKVNDDRNNYKEWEQHLCE